MWNDIPRHSLLMAARLTAPAGSLTSRGALPAPPAVCLFSWGLRPSASRKVPGFAVSAIGRLSICAQKAQSPAGSAESGLPPRLGTCITRQPSGDHVTVTTQACLACSARHSKSRRGRMSRHACREQNDITHLFPYGPLARRARPRFPTAPAGALPRSAGRAAATPHRRVRWG